MTQETDDRHTFIGVDGLTPYQRWEKHDAPYKAQCPEGLCVSYEHPINCAECSIHDEEEKISEPKSQWDAILGFVFYVCPCVALTVWLTGLTGANPWFQWGMTMFSLLLCTALMLWMQPMASIDRALEQWAIEKARIDAKFAEEEKKNPKPKETRDFKWIVFSVIVASAVFITAPDYIPFVLKWVIFVFVYIVMLSKEPKPSDAGEP